MPSRVIPPEALQGQNPAESSPFPAPVMGLNTRDSFMSLQPTEARQLSNWVPSIGACTVRPGLNSFATIASMAPVKTLKAFTAGVVTGMIAASGGSLYEVSSGTPSALASGYTNDYWSTDFMGGHLFGVNGTDTPWDYNGSTVSDATFTGATLTTLRTVKSVNNRLWFTEDGVAGVWYGPLKGVTGPLTFFDLAQVCDGGFCMSVFPWQNFTVFFMSTGQVLVYQGDPGDGTDQNAFAVQDKYYAPALIEPDACVKVGSEVIAMTISGPISMDVIAAGNAMNLQNLDAWSKIYPTWAVDVASFGSNLGWFGKFINGFVYFNVATGGPTTKQYVFNTRNQAWTTYLDLPLASLEFLGGKIFIGSQQDDGMVYQHSGGTDNGNSIVSTGRPGFSYLEDPAHMKKFTSIVPNIFTSGQLSAQFVVDVDFVDSPFTGPTYILSDGGATVLWGSVWGADWGVEEQNSTARLTVNAKGRAASVAVRALSTGEDVQWFSSDVNTITINAK